MDYEKIYNQLMSKRQKYKLSKKDGYCESHHIKPRSIFPELEHDKNNIVNLTAKEHYVAHHLLMTIYKNKYGENHSFFHKMRNAFWFTCNINNGDKKEYVSASLYARIREEINLSRFGKSSWNSGKKGIYSEEYRQKISEHHADFTGSRNGRYGSRSMFNQVTQEKKIISQEHIQEYLSKGWVFSSEISLFNNGKIELFFKDCPEGFVKGKLPIQHTEEELKIMAIKKKERQKQMSKKYRKEGNPAYGKNG